MFVNLLCMYFHWRYTYGWRWNNANISTETCHVLCGKTNNIISPLFHLKLSSEIIVFLFLLPALYLQYLNDMPEHEGHTDFPNIDLSVRPVRGSAVIFCNVDLRGNCDPKVVHRANPVSAGLRKCGLNIWVVEWESTTERFFWGIIIN